MSDPEPQHDQPLSADAAQPSPSPSAVPQPDQQPIEQEQSQQATLSQQEQQSDSPNPEHPDQEPQQYLPPFQPLFTLVTDTTTGATHHAHVHYIFSDDEPDLLTDALGQYSIQQQQYQIHQQQQQQTASSSSGSTSAKPTPPQPLINDRAILLDLVPKPPADPTTTTTSSSSAAAAAPAYDVAWASSLSADWAVVSAKVSPMSADDNDTDVVPTPARGAADSDGSGLILRIEGVDLTHPPLPPPPAAAVAAPRAVRSKASIDLSSGSSSGVAQPAAQQEDYGAIVEEFDKRMVVLRKVLEAGRERQLKMAVDADGGGRGETGPHEPPAAAAEMPGRPASHTSIGHDHADNAPSGSRRPSNSSGVSGPGQQTGSRGMSAGSGGRDEWEQQPVG